MPLFSSISEIFASLSPRRQSADPRQQTSLRNPSRYSSRSPSPTAERPARRTRSAKNQISSGSAPVIDLDGDDGHLGPSQQPDLGWDTITAPAQTTQSYASREPQSSPGIATTFGLLRSPSQSAVDSSAHSGDASQMLNPNAKKKDVQAQDEARLLGGTRKYKDANAVKIQPGSSLQSKKKIPGASSAFRPTDRITRTPRDSQQSSQQARAQVNQANRSQVNEVKRGQLSLAGRHQSRLGGMSELKSQKGRRHPGSEGSEVKPATAHHKTNSSSPPRTSSSFFPKSSFSAPSSRFQPQTENTETMKQYATKTRSCGSPSTPLPVDEEFTTRAAQERRTRTTASGVSPGLSSSGESSDELQGDVTVRGGGRYIPKHLRHKRTLTGEGAAGPAQKKGKKVHDASQEASRVLPTQPPAVSSGSKEKAESASDSLSDALPVVQLPRSGATSQVKLATSPSGPEVIDLESPMEIAVPPVKTRRRGTAAKKLAEAEPKKIRGKSPQLEVRETPDLEIPKLESEEAVAVVVPSTRHGAEAQQGSSPQLEVRVATELEPKHPSESEEIRQVELPVQSRPDCLGEKRKGGKAAIRIQKVKKPQTLDPAKVQFALDHMPGDQAKPEQSQSVSPANSKRRKRDQLEPLEPDVQIRRRPESESPPAPKRRKSEELKSEGEAGEISSSLVILEGEDQKDTKSDDQIRQEPQQESPPTPERHESDGHKPEGEAGQTVTSPVIRESRKRKAMGPESNVHIRQRPESESARTSKRRESGDADPEEADHDVRPLPVVQEGEKPKRVESDVRTRQQPESESPRTSKRRKSDELDAEDEHDFRPLPVAQEGEKRKGMDPDVRTRNQKKSEAGPGGTKRRKLKDALAEDYDTKSNVSMKDPSVQDVSGGASERRATRSATQNTQTDIHPTSLKAKAKKKNPSKDMNRAKWREPLVYPKTGKKRAEVTVGDRDRLREDEYLNDNLIAFYLRFLEDHIHRTNEELAKRIYFFNSYFFEKLRTNVPKGEQINYEAVEKWTRNINLFEYDYIIVPINEDAHWFLSIIYNLPSMIVSTPLFSDGDGASDRATHEHPKEVLEIIAAAKAAKAASVPSPSANNETQPDMDGLERTNPDEVQPDTSRRSLRSKPLNKAPPNEPDTGGSPPTKKSDGSSYILTFDSLDVKRSQSNSLLRKYLISEAQKKLGVAIPRDKIMGRTIQNIPLQPNYTDCGLYLLAYMEKFIQDPVGFVDKITAKRLRKDDWPELESNDLRDRFRSFLDDLYDEQNSQVGPPQHPLMAETTPVSFLLPPGEAEGPT